VYNPGRSAQDCTFAALDYLVSEENHGMQSRKYAVITTVFLATALGALAAPIGTLSLGITPGGGVNVSANLLDWYLPNFSGFGDATNGSTDITWSGGTLTALTNPYAQIRDIQVGVLPTNFIQFYVGGTHDPAVPGSGSLQALPTFDLTGLGPGSPVSCAVNPGLDQSCSVAVTSPPSTVGPYISPVILTQRANGTDASLNLELLGTDATGSIAWSGLATAQLANVTPAEIQAIINAGGVVNVQSWSFHATSEAVPEPAAWTFAVVGLGAIGFGTFRRSRFGKR
jgi:hypothetical protein